MVRKELISMITFQELATQSTKEIVRRTLAGERFYDLWSPYPDCDPRVDFVNAFFTPNPERPLEKYMNEYVSKMIGIPIVH